MKISSQSATEGITIFIDLKRATEFPEFPYIVQLMAVTNDLVSIYYLSELTSLAKKGGDNFKEIRKNAVSYLIRLQGSHLYEACASLIHKVNKSNRCPNGQDELIYGLIKEDAKILGLFEAVVSSSAGDRFKNLKEVRDNLAFHYGELAQYIPEAAQKLLEIRTNTKCPPYGEIFVHDEMPYAKYIFVDELLGIVWKKFERINKSIDYSESPGFKAHMRYKIELGKAFLEYANALIMHWVHKHKLQPADSSK